MFLLASMTKLLTSIAALQLVEAGLIKLDDDVSKILPEVGQQKILKGFDGDSPILEDRKNPLTLRHVSAAPFVGATVLIIAQTSSYAYLWIRLRCSRCWSDQISNFTRQNSRRWEHCRGDSLASASVRAWDSMDVWVLDGLGRQTSRADIWHDA